MAKARINQGILALVFAALLAVIGTGQPADSQVQGPIQPPPSSQPKQGQTTQQGQEQPAEQGNAPQYSVKVQTQAVNIDVIVTDDNGNPIPGLKKQDFRILDDGVPQRITNFAPTNSPITIVMLMEYSNLYYGWFAYTGAQWAYEFLNQLRPQDWVALVTYDLRPRIVVDFTHNTSDVRSALQNLGYPGFSESDMFDALEFTLNRLENVKGKKAILLISSGLNTFSSHTLNDILTRCKESQTTIFSVGVGRPLMEWAEAQGMMGPIQQLDFLQAENEMRTFSSYTGGRSWFPRFSGEMPGIFEQVAASLRSEYSLAYVPSDHPDDGKYHKIKVELATPDGKPLVMINQHHKRVRYHVYARQGYYAPKPQSSSKN